MPKLGTGKGEQELSNLSLLGLLGPKRRDLLGHLKPTICPDRQGHIGSLSQVECAKMSRPVITSGPDTGYKVGRDPHEPAVGLILGSAGLACAREAIDLRQRRRSTLDDLLENPGQRPQRRLGCDPPHHPARNAHAPSAADDGPKDARLPGNLHLSLEGVAAEKGALVERFRRDFPNQWTPSFFENTSLFTWYFTEQPEKGLQFARQ